MTSLTLALDWTPNINHIGLLVARERGFYRDQGLDVTLLDPQTDAYATTPAKKVELGEAHLALCPTESVISYRTKISPYPLIAIAALLQEDLSAIAVQANGPVTRPRELDWRTYASYQARYEDAIVKQMIRNDGGTGTPRLECPTKLGVWDTLRDGTYDATWVFENWEGVEAEGQNLHLRYFRLRDYAIPYSYSPVIAGNATAIRAHAGTYRKFLVATKRGYRFTVEHPDESVATLARAVPEKDRHISLREALSRTVPYFGDGPAWGRMDADRVDTFLDWLRDQGLEPERPSVDEVMTNELLE